MQVLYFVFFLQKEYPKVVNVDVRFMCVNFARLARYSCYYSSTDVPLRHLESIIKGSARRWQYALNPKWLCQSRMPPCVTIMHGLAWQLLERLVRELCESIFFQDEYRILCSFLSQEIVKWNDGRLWQYPALTLEKKLLETDPSQTVNCLWL